MIFFFFKQKSAYDMRISDWSSDVCSSDLMACSARGLQRSIQREIALGQIVKTRDGTGRLSTLSGEGKGSDSAIGWPPTHPGGRIETLRRREQLDADHRARILRHREQPPRAVRRHRDMILLIGRGRDRIDARRIGALLVLAAQRRRPEEHTPELPSLMRTSYAV